MQASSAATVLIAFAQTCLALRSSGSIARYCAAVVPLLNALR